MKRRLLASLLTLVMMLSLLPTAVWATDDGDDTSSGNGWPVGAVGITVAAGEDSEGVYKTETSESIWYKIDTDSKTLTIGGKGEIPDYAYADTATSLKFDKADWYGEKDSIENVVIEDGITRIGRLVITNMKTLKSIEIKGENVTLANGAVNNYQGNNGTLTINVPLSVYQQNRMGDKNWFTASSQYDNPTIEFAISNVNDIAADYADVLELDVNEADNWDKATISRITTAYEEYEALPEVVKEQLNDPVGTKLAELYAVAVEKRGWPDGAKGINIALEGFNGTNGKIGISDTIWYLLEGETLTLGGDGAFPYTGYDSDSAKNGNLGFSRASWYNDRASITSVDVTDGITVLDYLNLTNLYNCDDIYLRNSDIVLKSGAVCGYAGDANGKLTLHLYKSAYDNLPSGWYVPNNLTSATASQYPDPTLSYSFLEVEKFESKYADEGLWNWTASLTDEQKEIVTTAYNEYQSMDALLQNQLMNVDILSSGQTYGAKLLELYSLTTGGTVDTFPGTTDIYYSYDEATKTLTLTYTGSGTGVIPDYNQYKAPLLGMQTAGMQIENVVIDSKITSIGAYALASKNDITVYASVNTTLDENYAVGSNVTLIYTETQSFIDTYAKVWTLTGVVPANIVENGVANNATFVAVKNAVAAYKKLDSKVKAQLNTLTIDGGSTYYQQLLKVTGANDLDNMTKISGGIPNGMDENGCFTYMDGIHWTLTKNEGADTWTLRFDTDEGVKAALPDFGNSGDNTTATDFRNQPWYNNCFASDFRNKITKTYLGEGITGVGRYGLIHLRNCTDFYFENPDGVDLAGYAFDYYGCFPKFTPKIYLHSNSTLASNWADDLNKGADAGKNHTTADFDLIYTDALAFEQDEAFASLWKMDVNDAKTEENAAIIKSAMDAYNALSDKAKAQLKSDKCNDTDTYADKLMALAKAIGQAGDIGSDIQYTISSDGKTLTVTGSGVLSADLANDAWTEAKVGSVENLVIEDAITINNGALNNMGNLKTVDAVRDVKVSGGKGVFPNADTIVIRGYADARSTSLESYAKANTIKFQLKELNILCIGNSHTDDYTTYMQSILNDVNANLDGTKVTFSRIVYGSRKIGLTQVYTNGSATNYSHESCIQDVVDKVNDPNATSDNDTNGTYFQSLNPDANTWDLIIIQDYRESCVGEETNSNYVFIDHLRNTIKNLRSLQPTAQVAWFMDWLDHSESAAHYTDNSLNNYKLASEKNVEGNPDFIVAGATFIRTAMTSYLGSVKNLKDTESVYKNDSVTKVSQIWRDNTHMSYETGRYLAGASVAAKVLADVFSKEITFKTGDFYSALSYAPNSANSSIKQDWPGEFTPEIAAIVKASAKAAIEKPTEITTLTKYAEDPIQDLKSQVEAADFTNTKWNETAIKTRAEAVLAEKAGAKVTSVSVSGSTATITLRYGYSEAIATIYTPSDVAEQWTSYIESTNLGSTTVPGSDMKYSEVPQIKDAMYKGYSEIWAAKTEEAAKNALAAAKANLLSEVKDYVSFLLNTVYNDGNATILGDVAYTLSKDAYETASAAIADADTEAKILDAYAEALQAQTSKEHPTMTKTAAKAATCTEDGNNEYYTCDICNKVFKDENGTQETTVEKETIPATGHDWSNKDGICAVCHTKCTEAHKPGTTCEVCGKYTRRPSSSSTGNTVSVPSTPNGTVTVDPSTASKGETVTITTKPSEGYELGSIEVLDKNGDSLKLKDLGNGKYSFVMPDGKVSVEAEFVKTAPISFVDVPANAYFADAVEWAVEKSITNGLSDTMFGPYESCTRAQIVTFLWRAAGSPEPKAASNFTDVPANAYYAKAVAWAVENGVTNGMTETTFAPDATCTRGQSVTFLYRALKGTASGSANFTDVPANAFYADAVTWAVANNVTNGTSATTFSPNADCTRAEIVTFLYRAYQGK